MTDQHSSECEAAILTRDDGSSIAYRAIPGKNPGIVFLHGFMSDMCGSKAQALAQFCHRNGQAFLAYDAFGHGQSSGNIEHGTLGLWARDAVAVIRALTSGPQILVGSSLGGWVALLAALELRRTAAVVGIAAAPDFTEDLLWSLLSPEDRRKTREQGFLFIRDEGQDLKIAYPFIDEARNHLLLRDTINLNCPVRLLHGQKDASVPWQTSMTLADRLATNDVEIHLVKDGDHRLSRPQDLSLLTTTIERLIA